jgi:GT2 family glycosyltransferase
MKTISVVIPTLGRLQCLANTLRLLQKQTAAAEEIIVIDQTPAYDAGERALLSDLKRIKNLLYMKQDEPNASLARNAGLRLASNEVVLFLDDDVSFDEKLISRHLENYTSGNTPGVAGQVRIGGTIVARRSMLSRIPRIGWLVFPFNYNRRCAVESARGANLSVRRELAIEIGGMDERYERGGFREEADFCARFVRRFGPLVFDPEAWIDALAWPVGGIRTTSQKTHLQCEFYYIFKNITPPLQPAHLAYTVYRQWYLKPSVTSFWRESIPLMLSCAVSGRRCAGERPLYLGRPSEKIPVLEPEPNV